MEQREDRVLTSKGQRTRERIVEAAATLMVERSVAAVSLDEVGRATSTSKSQLYHYFASKDELLTAVADHVGQTVLGFQVPLLRDAESLEDLERWTDAIVDHQRRGRCLSGCPLGTLAAELSGHHAAATEIHRAFDEWSGVLEVRLAAMVSAGVLRDDAEPRVLATTVLALVQGGLLMAKATQDLESLTIALAAAVAVVRSAASNPTAVARA